MLEVVTGTDAVRSRFEQLQHSAVEELLVFDKPPYTTRAQDNEATERAALQRGVRCRVVYDRSSLTEPSQPRTIEQLAAAGEDARVSADVPMKLVICDRRLALTPLSLQHGLTDAALVVHASGLLDALAALFESVWQSAIPVPEMIAPADEQRRLLMLLASGLKDEAIARQLGIGERTVRRRSPRSPTGSAPARGCSSASRRSARAGSDAVQTPTLSAIAIPLSTVPDVVASWLA